jgi:ABC-type molybdate transport system permease subunit
MKRITDQLKHLFKAGKHLTMKPMKYFSTAVCSALVVIMATVSAYAAPSVADSKIAKGTEKLIQDVTTWLMVLAPVVTGLLIIYFCIRRSAADEMDQKKWNNRIVVSIVSCIGAGCLAQLR